MELLIQKSKIEYPNVKYKLTGYQVFSKGNNGYLLDTLRYGNLYYCIKHFPVKITYTI